jgi:hypothetical protein
LLALSSYIGDSIANAEAGCRILKGRSCNKEPATAFTIESPIESGLLITSVELLQFTGEGAKTKPEQLEICRFIVRKGITVASLRNEIYCQVIRQIINNPRM